MSLALLTIYIASLLVAQTPPAQFVAGSARVAGRVVDAESRAPVAGARVMLMPMMLSLPDARHTPQPPGVGGSFQAVTDANGEFVLEALLAGRYAIDVQKAGFAPFSDRSEPRTLDVAAEQSIAGLELALKRGGAITGRIVDQSGEPLSEITVTALRQTAGPSGQSMATTAQMSQTNDLGEFRLAGLPEGEYVVIAAARPQSPFGAAGAQPPASGGATVLAPTYYPGTVDRDAAHRINVGGAQTVSGVQFSLVSVSAYHVSGTVVDESGSPHAGAMVTLVADPRSRGPVSPAMGSSDRNGEFRIGGVVPGTYKVLASMPTQWFGRGGSGASGGVASGVTGGVVGGVYVGGASAGGVAVSPTGGVGVGYPLGPAGGTSAIEVTVDNTDVTGLKIVLPVTPRP